VLSVTHLARASSTRFLPTRARTNTASSSRRSRDGLRQMGDMPPPIAPTGFSACGQNVGGVERRVIALASVGPRQARLKAAASERPERRPAVNESCAPSGKRVSNPTRPSTRSSPPTGLEPIAGRQGAATALLTAPKGDAAFMAHVAAARQEQDREYADNSSDPRAEKDDQPAAGMAKSVARPADR
jgi:hypothetical protein